MRLPIDGLAKSKNYIHGGQGVVIAVAWLMCIIIFTRDGHSDGRLGWFFGLCWLSIPILIYLVMVPMWSRVERFSNIYAFAVLDGVSAILWLSAWAAMASYVSEGKGNGDNEDASGCDNFKFGSPARCRISQGVIVLGVVLMLAFIGTALISAKAVMHYRRTGEMPNPRLATENFAKQTQDAFSSNMRNDDPFEDNQEHLDPRQGGASGYGPARFSEDDESVPLHNNDTDITHLPPTQPAGPLAYGSQPAVLHDYDTSYSGNYGRQTDGRYENDTYNR